MHLPAAVFNATPAELIDPLDRAARAALAAGRVISATPVGEIREKSGPRDIVTETDAAAERAAIVTLMIRDDERLCAEESAPGALGDGRVWTIDPLDGTMNYAHGLPLYGPAIALVQDGQPLVAATYDVSRDELFLASRGGGAWIISPARVARLRHDAGRVDRAICYTGLWNGGDALIGERILTHGATLRSLGASAIGLAWAAAGRFEIFAQRGHLWPWDVAGGMLLCREAGMRVSVRDFGAGDGDCTVLASSEAARPIAADLLEPLGLEDPWRD